MQVIVDLVGSREHALELCIRVALASGWQPRKWWQYWRRNDWDHRRRMDRRELAAMIKRFYDAEDIDDGLSFGRIKVKAKGKHGQAQVTGSSG